MLEIQTNIIGLDFFFIFFSMHYIFYSIIIVIIILQQSYSSISSSRYYYYYYFEDIHVPLYTLDILEDEKKTKEKIQLCMRTTFCENL